MKRIPFSPSQIIVLAYITLVTTCTMLLLLPISQINPLQFIDVLFTAVSTATGAGTLTISLNNFSTFGITVITIFMQLSALGFLGTILYVLYIFFHVSESMTILAHDFLGLSSRQDIHRFTRYIIKMTLFIELIGAMLLFWVFKNDYDYLRATGYAIFHSIAAFTNTGFALFEDSVIAYNNNPIVLSTLTILMLAGLLGFIVLRNLHLYIKHYFHHQRMTLSLSTRITVRTITGLIVLGSAIFWLLKKDLMLSFTHPSLGILNSVFNTVSALGTGFTTIATETLSNPLLLLIMVLALIGSSPGSSGSGLQTTTVAVFMSTLYATLRRKKRVIILGTAIAEDQIYKAITVVSLSLLWICISTFMLTLLEPKQPFISLLFETVSSFSTLGLTTNLTTHLSMWGKILIMCNLTVGKIGSVTLIFAIQKAIRPDHSSGDRVLLS